MAGLALDWSELDGTACIRVTGWLPGQLDTLRHGDVARLLPVYSSRLAGSGVPAVAGRYVVAPGAIFFVPRFPLLEQTSYTVMIDGSLVGSTTPQTLTVQRSADARTPQTRVLAVYPSHTRLPRNALRFYVEFSDSMREGVALRNVRICGSDGEPLEDALLPTELWDPDRRRLTVLLDPGRIKRGLVPHAETGYPFRAGEPVTFVVDAAFPDAAGRPLRRGYRRTYDVGPDVRERVRPDAWSVSPPAATTTDDLVVAFDRPLDRGLLQHALHVADNAGDPVAGRGETGAAEMSWRFTPSDPWRPGRYALIVDATLEDVAGNSVARVFDRDLARPQDEPVALERVVIRLEVAE